MLADRERKLLRIVANLIQVRGRPPSIEELARRSGRTPGEVKMGLRELARQRFILWSPERHASMQVVKAWEDHQLIGIPKKHAGKTTRPWWERETRGYKDW